VGHGVQMDENELPKEILWTNPGRQKRTWLTIIKMDCWDRGDARKLGCRNLLCSLATSCLSSFISPWVLGWSKLMWSVLCGCCCKFTRGADWVGHGPPRAVELMMMMMIMMMMMMMTT